jgi:predicted DNA-binding ribbon-helix-helix protein
LRRACGTLQSPGARAVEELPGKRDDLAPIRSTFARRPATALRHAEAMTTSATESMLLAMALDTTIKVERALRERIRTAAQAQNLTVNEFLTRLMKEHDRRDRMARAAAAMRAASPEVLEAYREETKIWDRALGDGLEGW